MIDFIDRDELAEQFDAGWNEYESGELEPTRGNTLYTGDRVLTIIAAMPSPTCETCRYWGRNRKCGDPPTYCRWMELYFSADFVCGHWQPREDAP